jgi:signal peptidase I
MSKHNDSFTELLKTLAFALLLALTFRSLFFEPFHIPSGSMKDTLLVGDYIFVSKYSYGYSRYSFPLGLDLFDGRFGPGSEPKRGDVVVFRLPSNTSIDYIKRLIGLPGDRIRIEDGIVYLNDKPIPRQRSGEFADDGEAYNAPFRIRTLPRYKETLPSGKTYHVLDSEYFGDADNTAEYIVPEGHYFMMGDNRDHSIDSRFENRVGFIPRENLIGRAEMIFISVDDTPPIWKLGAWFSSFRKSRFFKAIE